MNINDRTVEVLSQVILDTVNQATQNLNYDRTYDAYVTESLGNNKYKVKFNGAVYTAPLFTNKVVNVGDMVKVTVPKNNWSNIYISSVIVNATSSGGANNVTKFNSDGSITVDYGTSQEITTFVGNQIITKTYMNGSVTATNTITFNSDGSISEEVT